MEDAETREAEGKAKARIGEDGTQICLFGFDPNDAADCIRAAKNFIGFGLDADQKILAETLAPIGPGSEFALRFELDYDGAEEEAAHGVTA
jgi:hypothetical protein